MPRRGDSQNKNTQRAACDYQDTLRTRSGAKRLTDCLGISVLQGVKSVVTSNAAQDATGRAITVPNEQVRKRLFCGVCNAANVPFYQARLGTNTGKALKRRVAFSYSSQTARRPPIRCGPSDSRNKTIFSIRSSFSFGKKGGTLSEKRKDCQDRLWINIT